MDHDFLQLLLKYNIKSAKIPLSERLNEASRFEKFSAESAHLLLDFSRTGLDEQTLSGLLEQEEVWCGPVYIPKRR